MHLSLVHTNEENKISISPLIYVRMSLAMSFVLDNLSAKSLHISSLRRTLGATFDGNASSLGPDGISHYLYLTRTLCHVWDARHWDAQWYGGRNAADVYYSL